MPRVGGSSRRAPRCVAAARLLWGCSLGPCWGPVEAVTLPLGGAPRLLTASHVDRFAGRRPLRGPGPQEGRSVSARLSRLARASAVPTGAAAAGDSADDCEAPRPPPSTGARAASLAHATPRPLLVPRGGHADVRVCHRDGSISVSLPRRHSVLSVSASRAQGPVFDGKFAERRWDLDRCNRGPSSEVRPPTGESETSRRPARPPGLGAFFPQTKRERSRWEGSHRSGVQAGLTLPRSRSPSHCHRCPRARCRLAVASTRPIHSVKQEESFPRR